MLPMWLKLSYAAFVSVLVPVYVRTYGPGNFLWFSDVALLFGCAAAWLEHPLLASTQAIAVLVPESLWIAEFALRAVAGRRLLGLTDYMFDGSIPRSVRALSLFHVWLPWLLVWMVWRLGYDDRALQVQIVAGSMLLLASRTLTAAKDNVNWVHRWGRVSGWRPLVFSLAAFPLVFYLPAHVVLRAAMPRTR